MRLFKNTNYDFIGNRKIGYVVTTVLLLVGLVSALTKGLTYGIDFKGGVEVQLKFGKPVEVAEIRSGLNAAGIKGEIKRFGAANEILIRTDFAGDLTEISEKIKAGVAAKMPENPVIDSKNYSVGARIANDLKVGAVWAVFWSVIVILVYIAFRFDFRFGIAAIFATFHDVLVVLGLFSLLYGWFDWLNLEIDQTIIAAFLTIVGYSVNDTVVVFDRIRENRKIFKGETLEWVMNKSVNSTLSRTTMTAFTTFLVMVVLFIFGGEPTRAFSFGMMLGIVIGTYSSIFVASPIVLEIDKFIQSRKKK